MTRRSAAALALILSLGLLLRLAVGANAPAFVTDIDSADFFLAGYNVVQSGELVLGLKRAPLYPLFLAGVIATLGPNLEAVALVQHGLGLVTVVLVYLLGALAFGRVGGLLAALGAAINGSLLVMEHSIMSEALFAPLLLAALLLVLLGLRKGRPGLLLLAGLTLGLGALTRPATQMVLPLAAGVVVLALAGAKRGRVGAWESGRRRFLPRSVSPTLPLSVGLLCLGYGLAVGPWMLHTRAVHGNLAISGGMGDALYARTHRLDPSFDFRDRGREKEADPQRARIRNRVFELAREHKYGADLRAELRSEFALTEAQSDAALRDAVFLVIRQEPQRYLWGTLGMFVKLGLGFEKPLDDLWESRSKPKYARAWPESIRFVMEPVIEPPPGNVALVERLTNLYQDHHAGPLVGILFLLGTARCLAADRRPGLYLLPLVAVTQLLLYVALDGPISRYRYPLQPLITLMAAGGLTLVVGWIVDRGRQSDLWGTARRRLGRGGPPVGVRPPGADTQVRPSQP